MQFLTPPWTRPGGVLHGKAAALSSTRDGGASAPPYDTFNLGAHVGDDSADVETNRARLQSWIGLEATPLWLSQVHSATVIEASSWQAGVEADGIVCRERGQPLVVMSADCLPVLLSAEDGSVVAAAHAGWRGLAAGVLANTVVAMQIDPARILAWFGPAISQPAFEVGNDVHGAFVSKDHLATNCFIPNDKGGWQADLKMLAQLALRRCGVARISDSGRCTYSEPEAFFSHRRNAPCGRMASLIWRI